MNLRPLTVQKIVGILLLAVAGTASAQIVTQTPLSAGGNVPGNMFFVPSVEFPTVISQANIQSDYAVTETYVGYFDSFKCYKYSYDSTDDTKRYFYPVSVNTTKTCNGGNKEWSGNFLNWATTQTIDPFRQALTGGYRVFDNNSLTVLEKARYPNSNENYFPNRRVPNSGTNGTTVQGAVGSGSWDHVTVRVARVGNRMLFQSNAVSTTGGIGDFPPGAQPTGTDYDGNTTLGSTNVNTLFSVVVRVKVCDGSSSGTLLEPNCVAYGSNYKPEGLIQKYAQRMRYSAFAYLNDSSTNRDGGVMRARQTYVGPQRLNPSTGVWETNPNAEWDSSTGVLLQDPDPTDSAATDTVVVAGGGAAPTLNNSGVINYLNKFGEMTNTDDKSLDPVSELYDIALRYLRGKTNVHEYSDLSGTAQQRYNMADGFPVITSWDDPLQYYCQNNAFLGIGDVYTWNDKNLKGNTVTDSEPALPSTLSSDPTEPDAVTWSNRVSVLEGFGAAMPTPFVDRSDSAYIAGLAYYAHTQDLRPDVTTDPLTKGMQTASTYWVDVRETQNTEPPRANMYWLAAKYGGFTLPDPDGNNTFTTSDFDSTSRTAALPLSWWDGGDTITSNTKQSSKGITDRTFQRASNYFLANQASKMYAALASAFAKIANDKSGAGSSLASNSTRLDSSTRIYQALFSNGTWMGQLKALDLDNNTGQPNGTIDWQAASVVPAPASRNIFVNAGGSAVAFASGNLTPGQTSVFKFTGMGTANTQDLIDYLRGDQTNEESNTNSAKRVFRVRTPPANWSARMGDIVNSTPIFVGAPNPALYSGASFAGAGSYAAHASTNATRTAVLWAGSNDGMLHAYNASTGVELYAFIPNQVISNGLAEYANPDYGHKYFVDGDMAVADVYDTGTSSWKTVLVATLGRGGPGIFALDVTNPSSPIFLWEKNGTNIPELGRNIGRPVIAQIASGSWRVLLGNGVDSTSGSQLLMINVLSGAVTVAPAEATNVTGDGLSAVLARDNDGDGLTDTVYAGGLKGSVYKFTGLTGSITSTKMFTAAANQAITAAPFAAKDPLTNKTWVFFGTGQYLNATDIGTTYQQTWYGIQDTGTFPIASTELVSRTFTDTTATSGGFLLRTLSAGTSTDLAGMRGWSINLPISGERMVLPNRFSAGVLIGTSLIPDAPDACQPTGRGVIMAINPFTGARLDSTFFDTNRDGNFDNADTANGTIVSGLIDDTAMTQSINVGSNILWQDMQGGLTSLRTQGGAAQAGRLSWREITN